MIIEVIFVMLLAYLFYRQGIRQLFKSRILNSSKADFFAYAFFMLAGLLLGTLSSLSIMLLWTQFFIPVVQIVTSSLSSIIIGEWMYRRNKYIIQKTVPQKE